MNPTKTQTPRSNVETQHFVPLSSDMPSALDRYDGSDAEEWNDKHDVLKVLDEKDFKFILALSFGSLGLQGVFSVFFGSGNFYLSSLGFSKTLISICWLSGPIAGLIFQPFVGALSDNSSNPCGKRRPFIICGTIVIIWAMISIAWAQDITMFLSGQPAGIGIQDTYELYWDLVIFINFWIWTANLAIQPVQMGLRALVVDLIPGHQQARANAWMARLTLTGNMIGYCINSVDLTKHFGFLGHSHFQILCILVSMNLAFCVLITCYWAEEEKAKEPRMAKKASSGKQRLHACLKCMSQITKVTKTVCLGQFFSWLAWFPFLFYTAKYVSEIHDKSAANTEISELEIRKKESNQASSNAMLIFAASSLVLSIALPLVARPTTDHEDFANGYGRRYLEVFARIRGLCSLRRIWLACQATFCVCMGSTFFIHSLTEAYVMVAAMGIAFAGTAWIPFTLISQQIRKRREHTLYEEDENEAATVFGIHNMAIAAPQIVAVFGCSLVFFFSQDGNQDLSGEAMEVWLLRFGVFSTLAAGYVIQALPED